MRGPGKYSIETDKLNLWYGDFQALINVGLNVKHGLITGLIGPSGCGKTTLLRCFNRVNERYGNVTTTGLIKILGKNIYDSDVSLAELRKSILSPFPYTKISSSACAFTPSGVHSRDLSVTKSWKNP